jgi:DNA-binding Xre family transcriptional regulator
MNDKTVALLIARLQGDLSNNKFAKKAGVKPMNITRWTNGTKISLVDFDKLCIAANCKIHEVLYDLRGISEKIKDDYDIPEGYALQIHNLLGEVIKLEELNNNEDEPGALIEHMTEQIVSLREMIEKTGQTNKS